jgi:hypothetical protein
MLLSSGAALGAWLTSNWPAIAAAHSHAEQMAHAKQMPDAERMPQPDPMAVSPTARRAFEFLSAADAADVDAIADRIVPGGATPGAREAHAVYFIDRALATFFSQWGPEFQLGLSDFQANFMITGTTAASFAAAPEQEQLAFLKVHEQGAFFHDVRLLTVLGMFSAPRYGGNFAAAGWRLLGFEEQHAFNPPFGYYDRGYPGFGAAATVPPEAKRQ